MVEEEEEVEEVGEGMRAGIQNGGEILKFCNFKKCEFGTVANSFQVLRGNILVESKSQVEKKHPDIRCGNSVGLQGWRFEEGLRWRCIARPGISEASRFQGHIGERGKKAKVTQAGMNKRARSSATILPARMIIYFSQPKFN